MGLAWLPMLITADGEIVEPDEGECWLAITDRECMG